MFVNFGICFTKSKKMSYFTVIYNTHSLNVFTWIILCIFIFVLLCYLYFFLNRTLFTNYLCALLLLHGANFVHVIDDLIIIMLLLWFAGGIIFINNFFFFFFFVLISFESGLVVNKTQFQDLIIFCDVCPVKNKNFTSIWIHLIYNSHTLDFTWLLCWYHIIPVHANLWNDILVFVINRLSQLMKKKQKQKKIYENWGKKVKTKHKSHNEFNMWKHMNCQLFWHVKECFHKAYSFI